MKSSGAAFRAHLAENLYDIGFVPTQANPDVWRRPAVKEDGFEYYEYVLCYVDDILAVSHKAKDALKVVQAIFKLKDDKIEPPDMYLGATLSVMEDNGVQGWCMTSDKYVKAAVENVELELARVNQRLPSRCKTLMTIGYRPERDVSAEFTSVGVQRYQDSLVCYDGLLSLVASTFCLKRQCSRHTWPFHERDIWNRFTMCSGT